MVKKINSKQGDIKNGFTPSEILKSHSQKIPISHEENGIHGFPPPQTCRNHVVLKGKKSVQNVVLVKSYEKSKSCS